MLKQTSFVDEIKEQGRSEGRQEGRQEGINKERKKIIQNMLSKGFSIKQIAEVISIPEDVVKSYL